MKIKNSKLKIAFLGTPDYLDPIIQTLDTNFELIKTFRSPDEDLEQIKDLNPDLLVVASFGKIIPESILKIPKFGAINIHPSLLPKYRGPSPIQNQILDGVRDSGISFILMDNEMDHGPLLKQVPFQISENDTFQSLCEKMFGESASYIEEVIQELVSGNHGTAQNHESTTITKIITREDGYFDIEKPPSAEKLQRMIRAFYPWPGVWTRWNGKIVKFLPEGKVQMEGKKAADLKSFLNGYPDFPIKGL